MGSIDHPAPESGDKERPEARPGYATLGSVAAGCAGAIAGLNAAGLSLAEADASLTDTTVVVFLMSAVIFVVGLRLRRWARAQMTLYTILSLTLVIAAGDFAAERDEDLHLGYFLVATLARLPLSVAAAVAPAIRVLRHRPFDVWRSVVVPVVIVLLATSIPLSTALEADPRMRLGPPHSGLG